MKRHDARNVVSRLRGEESFARAGRIAVLIAALAASSDKSLERQLERRVQAELRRFPTNLEFTNAEAPGSRAFHPDFAALAPVIGTGSRSRTRNRVPTERPTANVGAGGRTTTQPRLRTSAPTADALAFQQRAAARPRSRRRIQGEQPRRSTELLASQWPVARARLLRERRRRGAEDLLVRHRRRRHRAERPLSRRRARRAAGRRPDCALTT